MGQSGELFRYSRTRGKTYRCDLWWYIYTAYAPFEDGRVLVKVGISSSPHERVVSIYCSSPFTVKYAAFTSVGSAKKVRKLEAKILKEFSAYSTRGEWLLLPSDEATKKMFAERTRKLTEETTKESVNWTRFTEEQIKEVMKVKLSGRDGEWGC